MNNTTWKRAMKLITLWTHPRYYLFDNYSISSKLIKIYVYNLNALINFKDRSSSFL